MKTALLKRVGATENGEAALRAWSRLKRAASGYDRRLVRDYLAHHGFRKLHIGGGWRALPGWLNTDIETIPGVAQMDATQPFPLPSGQFDVVYSEHMIEHVPYRAGRAMLTECLRVLKPGGTVRIVTPDLRSILSLADADDDLRARYVAWFCETFCEAGVEPTWDQALNTFYYSWGHQFIYTEETLRKSLEAAGFRDVRRTTLGESRQEALREMSNSARHPAGFLEFESIALEAEKP